MGGRLGTGVTLAIVGSRRSRGGGLGTVRVEAGAVAEHGAGDVEQAVGHRAQGSGVAVAAGAQCLILGATEAGQRLPRPRSRSASAAAPLARGGDAIAMDANRGRPASGC